jgi:hypothetical protein
MNKREKMNELKGLEIRRKQIGATIRVKDKNCLEEMKEKYPNATIIEYSTSDFSRYFSVVRNQLKNYYWLLINTEFMFAEDWEKIDEFENLIIEEKAGFYKYTKPEFLSLCMDYIVDDWTTILGFNTDISKYLSANDLYLNSFDNLWLNNNVSIYFKNIDAAFWQVFSNQGFILHSIKQNAVLLEDHIVLDVSLT